MSNKDVYNDVLKAYYDTSYLSHHGILGQKWGVRRFQNKDGTRTAAGKKRYAKDGDRLSSKDIQTLRQEHNPFQPSDSAVKIIANYYDLDSRKDAIGEIVRRHEETEEEFASKKQELQEKGIDNPEFRTVFDKMVKDYLGDQNDPDTTNSEELKELIEMEMKDGHYDNQIMDWVTWTYYHDGSKTNQEFIKRYDEAHNDYYRGLDNLTKGLIQERGSEPFDVMLDEFKKAYKKETGREYKSPYAGVNYMLRSTMTEYCKPKR